MAGLGAWACLLLLGFFLGFHPLHIAFVFFYSCGLFPFNLFCQCLILVTSVDRQFFNPFLPSAGSLLSFWLRSGLLRLASHLEA